MSLLQYTIINQSAVTKIFTYFSASVYQKISVGGFDTIIFNASSSYTPTQDVTGVPENTFVSDTYIPPSGSAWLWNNGEKVQYIKISNTPLTGSNISSTINRAEWIEFSMVGAVDKNGNYLYSTSPSSSIVERYIIGNANNKGTYNSIITNYSSPETSIAVAANSSSAGTGFSYIDSQFEIDQDCDPLLNNATEPRQNEWLQDVDYSVNAITPINFNQLINFTATKASVPQSNYTQLGFVNSRYAGSSTTRENINEYNNLSIIDAENKSLYSDGPSSFFINKGKGASLGKIPNVELNNAYIAYFNRIIDPYPILNNKVAYYVKYLIDEGGNILDPNISDINFSIFTDTFQLRDYDNSPTRVNTAISSIEQGKELVKLTDGLSSVYTVGVYPTPILYTQTSSIGHINSISLSGSSFYSALGLGKDFIKLGINIYSTQSNATTTILPSIPTNLTLTELEWLPINITPFKSNASPTTTTFPTSSIYPTYVILFPINDSNSPQGAGAGNILSDNYEVEGSFTFTTSTMPAVYRGTARAYEEGYIKNYLDNTKNENFSTKRFTFDLKPNIKPPTSADSIGNYVNTKEGFNVKSVKLTIITNPGGPSEIIYPPLTIEKGNLPVYGTQWEVISTGLRLTPDSLYLEKLIIENIYKGNVTNRNLRLQAISLIAGGWSGNTGSTIGYAGIPVKYDWTIEFEFTNVKQGTGLFFNCVGTMEGQTHNTPLGFPSDAFLFFGSGGGANANGQWKRTFTPTFTGFAVPKPTLKYSVTSPLSENAVKNTANGPFWRRYNISGSTANALTTNELYMSSSILNQTYGKSFYQAKLSYIGAVSTDFPLTIEPSFIEFDPVVNPWGLEEGDEIRFENNESLTYRITFVNDQNKNADSEAMIDKIRVVVAPSFDESPPPSDFDFFVVRRYKKNKNFIILDQQMPYGINLSQGDIAYAADDISVGVEPVNPSSSPGLLLPQYRVDKFNTNPDLVLKDLIEKGII